METLLIANERAAIVGDWMGTVRTVVRNQEEQDIEQWRQHLLRDFTEAGSVKSNEDHVDFPRAGGLAPTANPNEHILQVGRAPMPVKEYEDEAYGLSVRAAYDTKTHF